MAYPKTSKWTLSTTRIARFKEETNRGFERNCLSRALLQNVGVHSKEGFVRIGVHHIVDRIWFVDEPDAGYAVPNGYDYGAAIAEDETRHTLAELLQNASGEYVMEIPGEPEEVDVRNMLLEVLKRRFKPSLILTNIQDSYKFWEFKQFSPTQDDTQKGPLEGYFQGIPIYYTRLLPSGLTLTVDRQEVGEIEIKSPLAISVSDIRNPEERNLLVRQLPKLAGEDLDEKVSVLCYEIIKVNFSMSTGLHAFQILRTHGTALKTAI